MQMELESIQVDWNQSVRSNILAKIDNRLSSELISDFDRVGSRFIQLVMKYRMTAIAVGLRVYQKRFTEFPSSLDELQRVGIAPSELQTFANASFSYERKPTNVRLFDEDESWLPPSDVNSSSGNTRWDWKLGVEDARDREQTR